MSKSEDDTVANDSDRHEGVTYQVDEPAPLPLVAGVGTQYAVLSLTSMMLMPAVAFRAGGASEALIGWTVVASLVIGGLLTMLHARPIGRFGSGYVLAAGPASAAIAVTADALNAGGVAMLALLAISASIVQFALAWRMSLLRRLLTPTVSGTAMMLVPVITVPVALGMLDDVPAEYPAAAAPVCAGVTVVVVGAFMLRGSSRLRPWAPVGGIFVGALVGAYYGLYDFERVAEAAWFGVPTQWPNHLASIADGVDFEAFAGLLPAFVLMLLICTMRSMSISLAIQSVSWRGRRALDFRPVQGTIAADALSNLVAGLVGTMPNGAKSQTVGRTQLTGVASWHVGVVFGAAMILLALCPKVVAVVLAVPAPVFAGYLTVMIANLFVVGVKIAISEGADHRQGLIIGLSFWLGVGCQYGFIFPDFVATFAGGLLKSALTTGGLIAIGLTALLLVTEPRAQRIETRLARASLPALRDFARDLAERHAWPAAMATRLDAVTEEVLLTLLEDEQELAEPGRRLLVTAHREGSTAVLEFSAAGGRENIEDRLAVLGETVAQEGRHESIERDVSLRLLRHLAAEVRHRQYYDVDILRVSVEVPR